MKNINTAIIEGNIVITSKSSDKTCGNILVERNSGTVDVVPFESIDITMEDGWGTIYGKVCTRNVIRNGKSSKLHYIEGYPGICSGNYRNIIKMTSYLVKKDVVRVTPFGRKLLDITVACNDEQNNSQYPSCITWGKDAEMISKLPIGNKLFIEGRFQSREYYKESLQKILTAYEISVTSVRYKEKDSTDHRYRS